MDILACASLIAAILGLASLWWSGDQVVHYALELALSCKMTVFFVGFVMFSLAANLPELSVAITSALTGVTQVSAGDIIGANFSDIGMVLGITMLFSRSITIAKHDRNLLLTLLGATIVMTLISFWIGTINKPYSAMLLGVYALFIVWVWFNRKHQEVIGVQESELLEQEEQCLAQEKNNRALSIGIKLCLSLSLVIVSSAFAVHYAVQFAHQCGWPLETVGATIVAIGTSLPELILSLSALRRKKYAFIFGPMLGNVFGHGTLILGTLGLLSSDPVDLTPLRSSLWFMLLLFAVFGVSLYKRKVTRLIGCVLLAIFVLYLSYFLFQ